MENLFKPGKWLVLFCGAFVILYATLQYVSNQRLKDEAAINASRIFTWSWPGSNWQSHVQITDEKVISRNDHDAVVEVSGTQYVSYQSANAKPNTAEEQSDCSAKLTFYKKSINDKDYWILGQVQFP